MIFFCAFLILVFVLWVFPKYRWGRRPYHDTHDHQFVRLGPPDAIRQLLDELEANRWSRRSAWATLQRLRKFLEQHGTRIATPDDRNFET
jgi:hypothetical protein